MAKSNQKLSRRSLLQLGATAGLATALLPDRIPSVAARAAHDREVDQVPIRRAGAGLRAHDPDRAFQGYTLFKSGPTVYLIDMEGNEVHTWTMPYPGSYGYLTDRGALFYNGTIANPDYPRRVSQAGVALETDWDGNVLWEVRNPGHHHDGIRLRNGNVLLVCYGILPDEVASRLQGGMPGTEKAWGIDGDYLQEVTTDGRVVWEWRAWEHLDPVEDGIPWPMDERGAWTHANGVAEWPNGDITLSFRNISKVVTISRATGEIIWKLGSPPVSGQHAPTPLPNGNLLLFDNGPHRFDESLPFSRVLEIEPSTQQIVWKYQERRASDFFSPRISNASRLPNGNTLINEGWFGRFFEVTPDGDTVWEYVNPYFVAVPANPEGGIEEGAMVNQVFRAYRYSPEQIDRAMAFRP